MRWILAVALLSSACDFGFEKQSHVSKLRVLAVRADPPEVVLTPGQPAPAVEFTALAAGPGGEPVEVRYAVCDATGLPEATLDCPGAAGIALPATSSTSAKLDLNGAPAFSGDVPLVIGFVAQSGGQTLHGFAALTVRTSADAAPARNPAVLSLTADDALLPGDGSGQVHAGATVRLTPAADSDGVTFSFFSTAGDLDSLRATSKDPEVDWIAPVEPGPVQLWIVARDGRGGVGWLARTVQVVP